MEDMDLMTPFAAGGKKAMFSSVKNAEIEKGTAVGCEKVIAQILHKYGAVNMHLLKEIMRMNKKRFEPRKHLENMQKKDIIIRYRRLDNEIPLDVYMLKDRPEAAGRGIQWQLNAEKDGDGLLEHLRLLQWHIKTLKNNRKAKEKCFCKYIYNQDARLAVLSLIQVTHEIWLYAVVAPIRGSEDTIKYMLRELFSFEDLMINENRCYTAIPVILCESLEHMKKTARMLSRIEEFKDKEYLYTMDRVSMECNPLSMLYKVAVRGKENHIELTVYDMTSVFFDTPHT